jgi:prepilin-type processing-associated H-X9-DG protein
MIGSKKIFKLITVLLLFLSVFARGRDVYADDDFYVTVEPEDCEVNYPDPLTFHVEVNRPEDVASYQWYYSDGWTLFELEGESAKTDTLIIPAWVYNPNPNYVSCVITDKNGNKAFTEDAEIINPNYDDDLKVLYIGEYAVQPGQTLDLSDTFTGSGKVIYDANGTDITFEDVHYSNERAIFDRQLSPSLGVFFFGRHMEEPEVHFHFKGDNEFENVFFDEEYNSAGVVFNIWFAKEENQPTAVFDGDGTLTLKGGSNAIYCDGHVEIDLPVTSYGLDRVYCDSITGLSVLIDGNAKLDLHPNGTGIRAKGDLRTYPGAEIKVSSVAPHVSVGPTFKTLIQVDGGIYMQGTKMDLYGTAYPETFVPYGNYLVNFTGIEARSLGDINMDASEVKIAFGCEKGEDVYALNFCGIIGGENSSSLILNNASKVEIEMDLDNVMNATGILVPGDVSVDKDSSIRIDIASLGEVAGIEADRTLIVNDGNIDSAIRSYDDTYSYGIVTGGAQIELNDAKYSVTSKVGNGIALAADTGETGEVDGPVEGYEAQKLVLSGKAAYLSPDKAKINLYGVPGYGDVIKAETVFGSDMSAPANEVKIGVKSNRNAYIVCALGALSAFGAAFTLSQRNKKKEEKQDGEAA